MSSSFRPQTKNPRPHARRQRVAVHQMAAPAAEGHATLAVGIPDKETLDGAAQLQKAVEPTSDESQEPAVKISATRAYFVSIVFLPLAGPQSQLN